ncbi:MAG: hypothetical protein JNK14_07885 [Chitinophagaceae bacterium]|nr:hypothetical protein [Chitinophagaceae bacterium]
MRKKILFLACLFIVADCMAQPAESDGQYPFVHYTPKDGLVNSRVKKAYQDSKGRMYFLTYGGLSVYDGARFRNYTTQNGLPMNIVNDIMEIGNDSFLVATNSSNINLLVNGRIEVFKPEKKISPLVNHFYRHDDGRIYLSSDFGLYVLEKNKIHELNIAGISTPNGQPNLGSIAGVENYLVISINEMSSNKGLYLYDIKNNRICDSLTNIWAYLMGKDEKNRIWLSTSHQLLITDTAALKKGKLSLLAPDKGYQQAGNYSTTNIAFGKNLVWLVYRDKEFRNSELRRIDEEGNLLRVNLPVQTTAAYIKNIFIDRENNIWLGNDGEGVFKIVRSHLQIIENPFKESGKSQAGYVYYSKGVTWYTTISKKLFRKSSSGQKAFNSRLPWPPYVFHEEKGEIFANDPHHIYQASLPDNPGIINFKKIISLHEPDIFGDELTIDPYGAIIANQQSGVGVWVNNKLVYHHPIEKWEHIENIFIDDHKRLWVVKRSLGIDVFSLHPDNSSNYLQLAFRIPVEQLGSIRSFVIDKKGLIWVGTRDRGLTAYRLTTNKLQKLLHFDVSNGLSDNFVTSLACDSLNNIIAGTQSGLDLLLCNAAGSYGVENLSRNSNLFAYIIKTWADAAHAYALTGSGVVLQVTPAAMEQTNQSPQLLLEELKVNAKTIAQQQSSFAYKENNISFLVAAPSFIDEKQIRYTYLLRGSGNDRWSDTTTANSIINLTNLSGGKYVLQVKVFFHSDAYSPAELSYPFEIHPPWWQTWWFRSIALIAVSGLLVWGFRSYYHRKLERQMAILEKQQAIEKERTRIATDMHDELGTGLSRIKFLSQTISNKEIDAGIRAELGKITGYSDEMAEKMGEIIWALNEKNDTLADLVAYTRSYAAEYLSNHNISCMADTPLHLPGNFINGETRRNIFLSVKECLHNIIKHAGATKVHFIVRLAGSVQITIHDNGKGIDWQHQREYSNGIKNIQKRMKEINGYVKFTNEQGTKVEFVIPMPL